MLQPRFWQLLFFGLLSSFTIYSIHFSGTVLPSTVININVSLDVGPTKLHVLVTHGASFLGSHVALALLDNGHAVTLVDDHPVRVSHLYKLLSGNKPRLKLLSCDLSDAQQLQAVLSAAKPALDVVVHLADPFSEVLSVTHPLEFLSNSTSQILALLKAIDASGPTKLVVSSSYAVYGTSRASPVDESADLQPTTPQGHAAVFTENAVRSYAEMRPPFESVILRHASVMGADPQARMGNFAWPPATAFISNPLTSCLSTFAAVAHQQQLSLDNPSANSGISSERRELPCSKEFVHVSDLAAAYVAAISRVGRPPAVYNVGSGQLVTGQEVVDVCCKLLGLPDQHMKLYDTAATTDSEGCYGVTANITALQRETDWRPRYQLEDAIRHSLSAAGVLPE